MKYSKIAAAALLSMAALAALAASADEGAGFVRVEGGRTDFKVEGVEGDDTSYGVRGGYYFTPSFAVEGFYTRYGEDSDDLGRLKAQGIGAGVVGKTNFGAEPYHGFYVSGRAGVVRSNLDVEVTGLGSADDSDTNYYAGVGAGYDFNRNFGVGINYDYQEPKVFDSRFKLETWSANLEYRF